MNLRSVYLFGLTYFTWVYCRKSNFVALHIHHFNLVLSNGFQSLGVPVILDAGISIIL